MESESSFQPEIFLGNGVIVSALHEATTERTRARENELRRSALFSVILVANAIAFVAFIVRNHGVPRLTEVGNASAANMMGAILFRQENVINVLYRITVSAPHSLSLSVRRTLAEVFLYGGAHSACGTSAGVWFLLYLVLAIKAFVDTPTPDTRNNTILSCIIATMFCFITSTAHPRIRHMFSTYPECLHRCSSWIIVVAFWLHNGLVLHQNAREVGMGFRLYLATWPNFWFCLVSTCCTLLSWARLRRHNIRMEKLSDHIFRLHLKYGKVQPFSSIRLSTRPLLEWQTYTAIPTDGEDAFSILVTDSDERTRKLIRTQSSTIWVRGDPVRGHLYLSQVFKRIVIVATGLDITSCLSLSECTKTQLHVVWFNSHLIPVDETITSSILRIDPNALIYDVISQDYPELVPLVYSWVVKYDAEAVFVLSDIENIRLQVVLGMQSRGILVYSTGMYS